MAEDRHVEPVPGAGPDDPHEQRLRKYGSTLDRYNVENLIERIADYPEVVKAAEPLVAEAMSNEFREWLVGAQDRRWFHQSKAGAISDVVTAIARTFRAHGAGDGDRCSCGSTDDRVPVTLTTGETVAYLCPECLKDR